jgi:hypothetical protein
MRTGVWRIAAWSIAVAGVLDPSMTLTRPMKPEVALVADRRLPDPRLIDRVADTLGSRFTVIRGPSLGAAAVVSIGYQMPSVAAREIGRGFAVVPAPRTPFAAIASVRAARRVPLQARSPIEVRVHTAGARGRSLTVTLRRQGAAVDQVKQTVTADDTMETARLESVASAPGVVALTVAAQIDSSELSTIELAQTVEDERWAVLCFDRRPSWMATFVRRALEGDPRFVVTSRVATSRGTPGVTAGQPPAALSALPSLELFHTVIVGAAEELTADDAAGLSRFMRERGRTVVLLLDQPDSRNHSAALRSLTGVAGWTLTERADAWGVPLASAVLRPLTLPTWADGVAPEEVRDKPPETPSVWRTAIGRGSLLVSGALDAWRYRDANEGAFGAYWRKVVAAGAQAGAGIEGTDRVAPAVEPDERELVRGWAESRGGKAVEETTLSELAPAMAEALAPVSERKLFRPMRSVWWMLPFSLALGIEWWTRRRGGLR